MSPDVNDPAFRAVTLRPDGRGLREQVDGLVDGGVDLLLAETVFDTLVVKACLFAIDNVFDVAASAAGDGFGHDSDRSGPHALGPDGRGLLESRSRTPTC